jgi:hypothetical protein
VPARWDPELLPPIDFEQRAHQLSHLSTKDYSAMKRKVKRRGAREPQKRSVNHRERSTVEFFAKRRARADLAAFDRMMRRDGGEPPKTGNRTD